METFTTRSSRMKILSTWIKLLNLEVFYVTMSYNIGLVVSKYHREITSKMREKAVETVENRDAKAKEILEVPGSYDTPLAAKKLAEKEEIDCVAVIGAIVTGDTDHDEIIGHSTAKTLQEISVESDTPVTMAITGPGMSAEEAYERIDYASGAVESALDMVEEFEDSELEI